MLDLCVSRKNKINLSDYDYQADIRNRLLMAQFTPQDVELLEDILYGSIQIPLAKLKKNLSLDDHELDQILRKLSQTELFTHDGDSIVVDKEMRKYYDFQILKFDDDFKPNMNYIQGLLKKVPIHILPIWYAVPRSSNNIFASMIERYFKTPAVYERYLLDLNLNEPVMASIIADLFNSEELELSAKDIQKKHELTQETFEEYMLHLEFNFVCCTKFKQVNDEYQQVIAPFYEWSEYLKFRQTHRPKAVQVPGKVQALSQRKFHFVEDMAYLLEEIIHQSLPLKPAATSHDFIFEESTIQGLVARMPHSDSLAHQTMTGQLYFSRLASKLVRLGLAVRHEDLLSPHHNAPHWLNMEIEDKALYLYRHPENRTLRMGFDEQLDTEKSVREVEKSLERIQSEEWLFLDEFLKGVTCAVGDNPSVELIKSGPDWNYRLPTFNEEEMQFMRHVIMQRLFEVGMVNVGVCDQRECFKLLSFGRETLC